jgi:RHS repeat-associated protein
VTTYRYDGADRMSAFNAITYGYYADGLRVTKTNGRTVERFVWDGSARYPTLLKDAANVGTYTFDAYGTRTAITGSVTTPLGYAGQYTDAESGFIYMRARFYDPATGQFMTRDPLGWAASGQNLCGYVFSNPVNAIDPSGLFLDGLRNTIGARSRRLSQRSATG